MTTSRFPVQTNESRNDIPIAWHQVTPSNRGADNGYWYLFDPIFNADGDEIGRLDPRFGCYLTTSTSSNSVIVVDLHSVTGERIEVPVHARGILTPVYANGWYETAIHTFQVAQMYVGFPQQSLSANDRIEVNLDQGTGIPTFPEGGSDGIAREIGRNPPPA